MCWSRKMRATSAALVYSVLVFLTYHTLYELLRSALPHLAVWVIRVLALMPAFVISIAWLTLVRVWRKRRSKKPLKTARG
jgi:hypothetical protein